MGEGVPGMECVTFCGSWGKSTAFYDERNKIYCFGSYYYYQSILSIYTSSSSSCVPYSNRKWLAMALLFSLSLPSMGWRESPWNMQNGLVISPARPTERWSSRNQSFMAFLIYVSPSFCIAGSPADKADLEIGDEILEVNGKSLDGATHTEVISHIHQVLFIIISLLLLDVRDVDNKLD